MKKKLKQPAMELINTTEFIQEMKSMEPFEATHIKPWLYSLAESKNMNPNHLIMALRYKITGSRVGAGVAETIQVLGKNTTINRLEKQI